MSHRSRLAQHKAALQAPVPTFANKQPAQPPQQLSIEQLVPMLVSKGAERRWKIMTSWEPPIVRLVAECGPIVIPLDYTPDEARKLIEALGLAVNVVDPPAAEGDIPLSPELQDLLMQSMNAMGGCQGDFECREKAVQVTTDFPPECPLYDPAEELACTSKPA